MALLLTILIEAVVLTALAYKKEGTWRRIVFWSVAINIMTQPLFSVWIKKALEGQDHLWWPYFIGGECAVIILETALYFVVLHKHKMSVQLCAFYAFWANLCSLSIGLILPI